MSTALGLTWYSQWTSEGEGPYTLAAKLAAANPMSAASMRKLLLDAHSASRLSTFSEPNSFLTGRWMRRGAMRSAWSEGLADSTLSMVLGDSTFQLASDSHLRYCPLCIEAGFQSSLCQIDSLLRCPVHRQDLRNTCQCCNALTPAYAWNRCLESPMTCTNCAMPLSSAWGPARSLQWQRMENSDVYQNLQKKLGLVRETTWTDSQGWISKFPDREHMSVCRRAEGALLTHALGIQQQLDGDSVWLAPPEYLKIPFDPEAPSKISQKMRAIYDAYCKKNAPPNGSDVVEASVASFLTFRNRAYRTEDVKDAATTAYILFRRRFETRFRQMSHPLSTEFLSDAMKGLIASFAADLSAWSQFLEICYRAEFQYCQLLAHRTNGLEPGELSWREAIGEYSAPLSPLMLPLPYGVGIVKLSNGQQSTALIALAN